MLNKLLNLILAPYGICRVVGWQNIYRSGYFHRAGKPLMYDRHPGDLYPTRDAAVEDIDLAAQHLYVTTTKVVWYEHGHPPHVNCASSRPVPISTSRQRLATERGEFVNGVWRPIPADVVDVLPADALFGDGFVTWR